jgi:tetratricopeptide (TPR) repeat protein
MRIKRYNVHLVLVVLLVFSSIAFAQVKPRTISDPSDGLVALNMPTRAPKAKEAWFKYWGKCGYQNTKGDWVISPQFDWAGPFHEGYALVVVGARVQVEEVRMKWEHVSGSSSKQRDVGRVLLLDGGSMAVIDKTGRMLMELPKLEGKLGIKFQWVSNGYESRTTVPSYMDSKWNDIYSTDGLHFHEGRAIVKFTDGCNYLQKSGDSLAYAFPQPFGGCLPFSEGLAGVSDSSKKWGFIGMDGQWRIPATYQEVSGFSEGLSSVKVGSLWGAIDKTESMVIPAKYRYDFTFSEGLAIVNEEQNTLFIDNRGQTVSVLDGTWYASAASLFHDGLVLMKTRRYNSGLVVDSSYLDRTGKTVFSLGGNCEDFSNGVAKCRDSDSYHAEDSITFDRMGKIISKHGNSTSLVNDLAASPGSANADKSAVASLTPVVQDKAEYDAYISAVKSTDLRQRAAALEAFAGKYPNSVVKSGALEGAMFAYAQSNSQAKAAELAQIILKSDPGHVRALAIMTFVKRYAAMQNDPKAAAEVGSYAERGLKALAGWAKPNGMSDAEFAAARNQAEAILNGGAGYAAFRRNDYVSTRDYYLKALTADSGNILDTFELGSAELQMQPLDINGFWHTARAIQLARAQKQTDSDLIVFYEAMGKAKYREYHGSTDGWDALIAQATQLSPPPGFAVQRGSAPNPQNAGNKPAPEDAKTLAALAEIDGAVLRKKGDLDGAIRAYREAVQLNPLSAHFHEVLASILYDKRDFDAAIKESGEAIRLDPNVASAYYLRGVSYQQKADYYTALVDYNRALHFDPKYTNALGGRADVYYFTRQYRVAIEDYTAFIAAMPKSSVAYSRRGTCHYGLGEYRQTVMDYEKAIAMDPNLLEAVNGLAWVLATAPADGIRNGLMAVGYAERALSLAGKIDTFLHMDTLAAAYAEAGRFTDAIATQAKAISLIPKDYDAKEAAQFNVRLQAYKDSKPWREQSQK